MGVARGEMAAKGVGEGAGRGEGRGGPEERHEKRGMTTLLPKVVKGKADDRSSDKKIMPQTTLQVDFFQKNHR